MSFLKWLTNNRLGTHLFTRRRGEKVGKDALGNTYYRERGHSGGWRRERRWVVYAGDGEIEASAVEPGWNAWLHKNRERVTERGAPQGEILAEGARAELVRHAGRLRAARTPAPRRQA